MELDEILESIFKCIAIDRMTIRETADALGVPKSTVHYLIHHDLKRESLYKHTMVQAALDYNKEYRTGRRRGRS